MLRTACEGYSVTLKQSEIESAIKYKLSKTNG